MKCIGLLCYYAYTYAYVCTHACVHAHVQLNLKPYHQQLFKQAHTHSQQPAVSTHMAS